MLGFDQYYHISHQRLARVNTNFYSLIFIESNMEVKENI
jgi:hypothetical protein